MVEAGVPVTINSDDPPMFAHHAERRVRGRGPAARPGRHRRRRPGQGGRPGLVRPDKDVQERLLTEIADYVAASACPYLGCRPPESAFDLKVSEAVPGPDRLQLRQLLGGPEREELLAIGLAATTARWPPARRPGRAARGARIRKTRRRPAPARTSIARPGTYASDSGVIRISMIRSSLLAASTASGIQAIRSYQDSVYIEVTSQATDRTSEVRTAMVSGSRRGRRPRQPRSGGPRDHLGQHPGDHDQPAYAITPTMILAWTRS